MSAQHQNFVTLATRLIKKHGRPVILVSAVNAGTESQPVFVETRIGVKAAQMKLTQQDANRQRVVDSDLHFIFDAVIPIDESMRILDFDPVAHPLIPMGPITSDPFSGNEDDLLIADYSIADMDTSKPGSTITHYDVYARL